MSASCFACGSPTELLHRGAEDHFFASGIAVDYARCVSRACGALVQVPTPSADEIARFYAGYYTHERVSRGKRLERSAGAKLFALRHRPDRDPERCVALSQRTLEEANVLLDLAGVMPPTRASASVLDVGCGNGENLAMLSAAGFAHAHGVEWDERACEAARSLGFEVRVGSAESIPYDDASHDVLFLRHVIEHVLDLDRALSEIVRVLRPGGLVTFLTPNAASRMHARFGACWRGLEAPRHLRIFTAPSLAAIVSRSGLEIVRVGTNDRSAPWIEARSREASRGSERPIAIDCDPSIGRGEETFVIARRR